MREFIVKGNKSTIPIGREGENDALVVKFPFVKEWKALYGNGTFELMNQRPDDADPYPCVVDSDGDNVLWVINAEDVSQVGRGRCQLTYVVNDTIAKSIIFATSINDSIGDAGIPPEPYQSWVNDVLQAGAAAHESAERADSAKGTAEIARDAAEGFADQAEIQANYAKGIMGLAEFHIDLETGNLIVAYPTPYFGATFAINEDGYLEVHTNG